MLNVIPNIALAHSAADVKRHSRRDVSSCFRREENAANLWSVAMGNRDRITRAAGFSKLLTIVFDNFELSLCSRWASRLLKRVAS